MSHDGNWVVLASDSLHLVGARLRVTRSIASAERGGVDVSAPQVERGDREDETWFQAPDGAQKSDAARYFTTCEDLSMVLTESERETINSGSSHQERYVWGPGPQIRKLFNFHGFMESGGVRAPSNSTRVDDRQSSSAFGQQRRQWPRHKQARMYCLFVQRACHAKESTIAEARIAIKILQDQSVSTVMCCLQRSFDPLELPAGDARSRLERCQAIGQGLSFGLERMEALVHAERMLAMPQLTDALQVTLPDLPQEEGLGGFVLSAIGLSRPLGACRMPAVAGKPGCGIDLFPLFPGQTKGRQREAAAEGTAYSTSSCLSGRMSFSPAEGLAAVEFGLGIARYRTCQARSPGTGSVPSAAFGLLSPLACRGSHKEGGRTHRPLAPRRLESVPGGPPS